MKQVEALAVELARSGRLDEALARIEELRPQQRADALLAVSALPLEEPAAKQLVKAFRRCPKRSRLRDDQTLWKGQLATVLCAVGRHDEAIATAARMPTCTYARSGAAFVARRIARALEEAGGWTSERAVGLAEILAGPAVWEQDLPWAIVEVLAPARRAGGSVLDQVIGRIRDRFRHSSDRLLIDAVTGDLEEAIGRLSPARHVQPKHFAALARGAPSARRALLRRLPDLARARVDALPEVFDEVDASDVPVVLEMLGDPALPFEIADRYRDALCRAIVDRGLDAADALLQLVEAARDESSARPRAWCMARWLAGQGRIDAAMALGAKVGLGGRRAASG